MSWQTPLFGMVAAVIGSEPMYFLYSEIMQVAGQGLHTRGYRMLRSSEAGL